jgi:flagellar protein FliS
MTKPAPNPYLRTKIMTASPEELRLMLYEGCLKFTRQAKAALELDKPDYEAVYENFARAKKIVLELSTSLNHQAAPELCEKLSAVYTWVYRLLVDANMDRDISKIDEAIRLLDYERDTWLLLMKENAKHQPTATQAAPAKLPGYGAQQTAVSTLSQSA